MNGKTNSVVLSIGFLGLIFGLVGLILPHAYEPSEAWQTDAPFQRRHMYYPMGADNDVRVIGGGTSDLKAFNWYLTPQCTLINTGRYYILNIPETGWNNANATREFEVGISVRDMRQQSTAGIMIGDGSAVTAWPYRGDFVGEHCAFWFEGDNAVGNSPVSVWTETQDGVLETQTDVDTFADNSRHVLRIEMDMPNSEVRYYIDSVLVNTDATYSWGTTAEIYGRLSLSTMVDATVSFTFYQAWYHSDYF